MPEVTVRDAHRNDASDIGQVAAAAVPYLVRSSAAVAAEIREDGRRGRRRWVGLLDDALVGSASARQLSEGPDHREVFLTVKVRPDRGSQGVGTALLRAAASAFPGATRLVSVGSGDPISMSFAVRNGFLPESLEPVALVDPRQVAPVEREPEGLRPTSLEALPDMRMLLETQNLAAADDPTRRARRYTMYQLRAEWWDRPDNAPDLSWGLMASGRSGPVLAAFTGVRVDRERDRSWVAGTATHPSFHGRGLARWAKQRTLNALAEAGVTQAWTRHDALDAATFAVDDALGYHQAASTVRLVRRLPR